MKKKILAIAGTLTLVIIVGAVVVLKSLSQPSSGTITVGNLNSDLDTLPAAPATVSTPYYTTLLPTGFEVKNQTDTPNNPLKLSATTATGGDKRQILVAITVGTLPSEGLSGVGDYNLRASQSAIYSRTTVPGQPDGAQSYRSNKIPNSLCVFWTLNSKYYEVTITSDGGDAYEILLPIYGQIASNWVAK